MGQDCKTTNDCVKGLACDLKKQTCDSPNGKRDAPAPQQCKTIGDCAKDQVCDQEKNTCAASKNKRYEVCSALWPNSYFQKKLTHVRLGQGPMPDRL